MSSTPTLERRLSSEELRREFDERFAAPVVESEEGLSDLLLIRVCDDVHALRTSELSGVRAAGKTTPLPSSQPALLGMISLRGELVPVFDLPLLLGYEASSEPIRWLALVGKDEPVALGFHAIVEFRKLPAEAFSTPASVVGDDGQERTTVNFDGQVRAVLAVPGLIRDIRERVGRTRSKKET